MSTTTKQAIIDEIENRFWNITKANGYFSDIEKVSVSKLTAFQSRDLPAINFHMTGDSPVENKYGRNQRQMTIIAEMYSKVYEDIDVTKMALQLEHDLITALNRSTDNPAKSDYPSRDLGGLIKYFTEHDMTPIISGSSSDFYGVAIEFNINYILDAETLS